MAWQKIKSQNCHPVKSSVVTIYWIFNFDTLFQWTTILTKSNLGTTTIVWGGPLGPIHTPILKPNKVPLDPQPTQSVWEIHVTFHYYDQNNNYSTFSTVVDFKVMQMFNNKVTFWEHESFTIRSYRSLRVYLVNNSP